MPSIAFSVNTFILLLYFQNLRSLSLSWNLKPIWVFTRDGHDGPQCPSTRQTLIKFFKKRDTDFFVAVFSAGLLVHHFIERRMAPLSKELTVVVLPHDTFGSRLDENRVSVDAEKEVQNFKKAGFKFIYIFDFISVLIMFSVTYHLNDINDIELPKTFRPCINSLKTEISIGDWGFFLKSKSMSATK